MDNLQCSEYRFRPMSDQFSSRIISSNGRPALKALMVPGSLNFGDVIVGTESAKQVVTLLNEGYLPLQISAIRWVGDFHVTTDAPANGELPVNGYCSFTVTYRPTSDGNSSGALYVDTLNTEGNTFITLQGRGVDSMSGPGGGGSSFIPWVYNGGSANGGELTLTVTENTVSVPELFLNGLHQEVGLGFTFDPDTAVITLADQLEEGDEVIAHLSGVPANPDNPNIDNWHVVNWLYNEGSAIGGEQVLVIPYTFQTVVAVFKNGLRYVANLLDKSFSFSTSAQSVTLTEALAPGDRVVVQIGGEFSVIEMSDRTLYEVARSANVPDSAAILSNDQTTLLDGKRAIYDVVAKKIWAIPAGIPSGATVGTVSGSTLVYNAGSVSVTLIELKDDSFIPTKQPLPNAVERSQHLKNLDVVSVKDFDAKGDGVTDDAAALNAALAGGNRKVIFPDGDYLIKSYVRVYKNTTIEMSKGCRILNDNQTAEFVFVNGELGNAAYATGYDGEGNILIQGGTIDNGIRAGKNLATKGISIAHATNVTIRNVTLMNNYQSHFIEINSTKGALIDGCRFFNLNPGTTSTDGSRECINIDYASEAGFPEFGGYDNTVCDDVKVVNCQFDTGDVGVGSHGISPLGPHLRINISNNSFRNMQSVGIASWCWSESLVHGNKLLNCGTRCMKVWACTNTVISNNVFDGQGSIAQLTLDSNNDVTTNNVSIVGNTFIGGTSHQIRAVIAYNILFAGNTFKDSVGSGIITSATAYQLNIDGNNFYNCGQSTAASGIRLGSPNCKVVNNQITGLSGSILYGTGIYLEDGATDANLADNLITPGVTQSIRYPTASLKLGETLVFSLAPDTVGVISIETPRKQGTVLMGASNKEIGVNGLLFVRAIAGQEDVTKIATIGTFATAITALTGTTGAAGQVTLSANAGKLYIENRIAGSSSIFRIQLMTV